MLLKPSCGRDVPVVFENLLVDAVEEVGGVEGVAVEVDGVRADPLVRGDVLVVHDDPEARVCGAERWLGVQLLLEAPQKGEVFAR